MNSQAEFMILLFHYGWLIIHCLSYHIPNSGSFSIIARKRLCVCLDIQRTKKAVIQKYTQRTHNGKLIEIYQNNIWCRFFRQGLNKKLCHQSKIKYRVLESQKNTKIKTQLAVLVMRPLNKTKHKNSFSAGLHNIDSYFSAFIKLF